MNSTIELLHIAGSPFSLATSKTSISTDFTGLFECSRKNRIVLLFLESIKNSDIRLRLSSEVEKHQNMLISVSKVSNILTKQRIEHAIHKTIRPYRSATVDIDILIFGDSRNHTHSYQALEKSDYELVVHGPRSTTMMDTQTNIGIDLYQEIAVSNIIYIDKDKLASYTTTLKLPNGTQIKNLKPEADLLCIIAHSIIKEQMYTLSEYYTFIHYLKVINPSNFTALVKQTNLTIPTKTHASITALLHKTAHGTVPTQLQQILNSLDNETFETTRLIKNKFATPHKYHPITVGRSLLEITKERKARNSMATQLARMVDPNISKDFLKKLTDHVLRETY